MVKRVKKKRKLALDGVVCVAFRSCWCVGMLGRTIVVFRKWKISKKIRRSHNVEGSKDCRVPRFVDFQSS
jgi:hypothetical protein